MSAISEFRPFPFLRNPHLQTVVAAGLGTVRPPPSAQRLVSLADGDKLSLEISTPPDWRPGMQTVLLVHGLCGCDRSSYVVRLARKLLVRGVRAVRVNQRGCGSGLGLARQLYHAGRSDDLLAVLVALGSGAEEPPMTVLGFSLGGNLALRLAGELGEAAAARVGQVIAVSPPADLLASSRRIRTGPSSIYERFFVRELRAAVKQRHSLFPDLGPVDLPPRLHLEDFDDVYTAPHCGFRGVLDYYETASSASRVPRIAVPCRILLSRDDPFIDCSWLQSVRLPATVSIVETRHGGHLGFLGRPSDPGGLRWMDAVLLDWLGARRTAEEPLDAGGAVI